VQKQLKQSEMPFGTLSWVDPRNQVNLHVVRLNGFTFLVPAYPGYLEKESVKWMIVLMALFEKVPPFMWSP